MPSRIWLLGGQTQQGPAELANEIWEVTAQRDFTQLDNEQSCVV